jgi:sugar lactone lactonase YvrE
MKVINSILLLLSNLTLFLMSLSAAPQDNWYLDEYKTFGHAWGMRHPIAIAHGTKGRTFVVEYDKDRVQFRDANQSIINLKGCGENPRGVTYADGKVYVVSEDSERVYVFNETGQSLFTFGSDGTGNGQFKNPYGIASGYDGDDLEIFVTDPDTDRITVFDENGTYKRKFWSVDGNPRGIVVDDNGSVYVSDQTDRINVFNKAGTLLRTITGVSGDPWGLSIHGTRLAVGNSSGSHDFVRIYDLNGTFIKQFGTDGSGDGQFKQPYGVAYDTNGSLWVADYGNHRIQVFDGNGTFIRRVGEYIPVTPSLEYPNDIAYDLDSFYVSDSGNNRVVVFDDGRGRYTRTIAKNGTGTTRVSNPRGITLTDQGRIYVVDRGNERIQVYENNGTHVRSYGNAQIFNDVWGVAVANDGSLFVSDFGADKILVFDAAGNLTGSWGESGSLNHQLDGPSDLQIGPEGDLYVADFKNYSIKRFTIAGQLVKKIDLRSHGGSNRSEDNRGSKPRSISVREDGLIITSAIYEHNRGKFWIFDKLGNRLWTRTKSWSGNYSGTSGLVAFNPMGKFVWVWDRYRQFNRYHSSYRAGPLVIRDSIPYPMLISAGQQFQSTNLDISYKVTDADDANITTGMLALVDGQNSFDKIIIPKTFIGDVTGKIGQSVDVNVTHSISWDMPQDWNVAVGNVKLEIFAKDDRELIDLHLVTIPADDGNATPLTINRFPLKDSDFLDVWHYLLATQDPGVKLENGVVMPADLNATPISPASLSGKLLWLDASDVDGDGLADSLGNNSKVSLWKDKSGNDFNATQSTSNNQPVYKTNDGGYPALSFSDHWLDLTAVNFNAKQIFVATKCTSTSDDYMAIISRGSDRGQLRMDNRTTQYRKDSSSFTGSDGAIKIDGFSGRSFSLNKTHILSARLGTNSEYSGNYENMIIGRDDHSNDRWKGSIYEILVFDRFLSDSEEQDVEWYLTRKWGAYGSTPPGAYAVNTKSKSVGINYLLGRMNLRRATTVEVTRAREATTPGNINKFTPEFQILPGGNPEKINEFTIETERTGTFVVPN